jgi:hypothetical protein
MRTMQRPCLAAVEMFCQMGGIEQIQIPYLRACGADNAKKISSGYLERFSSAGGNGDFAAALQSASQGLVVCQWCGW